MASQFFDPSFRGAGSPGSPGVGSTIRGLQQVEMGRNKLKAQEMALQQDKASVAQQQNLGQFTQKAIGGDLQALGEIAAIDPAKATEIQGFLSKMAEVDRNEVLRENEALTRTALNALTIKDPLAKRQFLTQERERFAAEGRNTARIDRALQSNDAELDQLITFQAREGQAVSDIAKGMFGIDESDAFGRVVEGVKNGERVFFQAGSRQSQDPRVIEGIVPPKSDAQTKLEIKRLEEREKKEKAAEAKRQQAGIVSIDIDRALSQADGLFTTGFTGALASSVPGTPAFDLNATLNGIKANVGFNKLQEMRENSPTGGALGQVSENENRLLQSVLGSVEQSQSEPQLKRNLSRLKVIFDAVIHGTSAIPFTQAQFDKLPSGARYISPDTGTLHEKQ